MTSENNFDIIQTSRRFFGYALSHSPESLYEHSNKPKSYHIGIPVTDYLASEAINNQLFTKEELRPIKPLFSNAIDNTYTIVTQEMHARRVPLEFIPLIARDERTIATIARLAMHDQHNLTTILSAASSKSYFQLSKDMTHVQATERLVDTTSGGCPFAASPQHVLSPDPLFRRTIHLAGDLIYLAHKK